jgi:YibE/F-like protein
VVPAILHGHSPVLVAVTGAMAIMLISLYLSHGTGPKTTAAVVGTALALGLTAALAIGFVAAASLTGLASDEALDANFVVGGLSLRGLLLAGIIIGGLGVLDDVTMSQASLVAELHQANPTAGFAALVGGALRVGRDHIAATVNTLFLAYAGAALPLLILFVTGQDSLGTVATTEIVAVEVVRALCGSVGLIAAVPLTTVLAALVVTEEVSELQPHPTVGVALPPEVETIPPTGAIAAAPPGRSEWALARGLGQEEAGLVLDRVLAVHGPQLSHALVDVDSGNWLAAEELPAPARTAAARLKQLAADAQRGASWYQRARVGGLVRLDLQQPDKLDLLRRYGAFTTDAKVWIYGDPLPVIETADRFGDLPRFSYQLDPAELERVQAALAEAGLPSSTLVPRRARVSKR